MVTQANCTRSWCSGDTTTLLDKISTKFIMTYKFIDFLVSNEIRLLSMESEDPEDCRETFIEEEIEAEEPRKILHNIVMLSHL